MTLRQLELFLALVKLPHIGKVAKQVGLSQSAISIAIKSLEEFLETSLFDRINKKLILNEHGRQFFNKVEPLVMDLKECEKMFRIEHLHGELKIGVSRSIAYSVLPQILHQFMGAHEGVLLKMETKNTSEVVDLIEKAQIDLGFIEGEHTSVNVVSEVLSTDELYIVTGDEGLAAESPYKLEQLLNKRWIIREKGSGTREVFLNALGKHTEKLNIFMELDTTGGIKSVLSNKDTLACLSQFSVSNEIQYGQLYRIEIEGLRIRRYFSSLWHKNKYLSPLMKEFIAYCRIRYP